MTKSFKGFLIDPTAETITEVQVEKPTLESLYKLTDCRCVTIAYLQDNHVAWVDDEGLLKPNSVFRISTYPYQPLAGKAVILGASPSGNHKDCNLSLEEITKQVEWCPTLCTNIYEEE